MTNIMDKHWLFNSVPIVTIELLAMSNCKDRSCKDLQIWKAVAGDFLCYGSVSVLWYYGYIWGLICSGWRKWIVIWGLSILILICIRGYIGCTVGFSSRFICSRSGRVLFRYKRSDFILYRSGKLRSRLLTFGLFSLSLAYFVILPIVIRFI